MKTFSFKYLSISILTLWLGGSTNAMNVYQLNEKNSELIVKGTASKHDWEMEATKFSAETGMKLEGNNVSEIQFVELTTLVSGLESDKKLRDKKAHEVLEAEIFPEIKYTMRGIEPYVVSGKSSNISGLLTVGGKTTDITAVVDFNVLSDRHFKVSGKVRLKMSDFGIEPPTAFLGMIKVDDEVEVEFNLEFEKAD